MSAHIQLLLIAADIVSAAAVVGSLAGILPPLASLGALVWYGLVIYDRIRYGPEIDNRIFRRQKKNLTPPPE
jgi:hypothetical protein